MVEDIVGGRRSGDTKEFEDTIFLDRPRICKDVRDSVHSPPNRITIDRIPVSSISSFFLCGERKLSSHDSNAEIPLTNF